MTLEDMLNARFTEYDGMQFQKFFYEIMRTYYGTDFEMPWPYGKYGDFKCDGYYKPENAFYACYAPENPSIDTNADAMIKKLNSDIEGLIKNINEGVWKCEFSKFVFVVNMKNKISVPAPLLKRKFEIEKELKEQVSKNIEVCIITQYDLKKIFNSMELKDQKFVLNHAFVNDDVFDFDGAIVSKIIEHFSSTSNRLVKPHNIMDFDGKVKFNNLSDERGTALLHAAFNVSSLQDFLEEIGSSACDKLQSLVLDLYDKSKTEYPDDSNLQFDYIRDRLYPINESDTKDFKKKVLDSKMIIMSMFFENCSIFESEKK